MNCNKKIENELGYTKWVKEVETNLDTKMVKVTYNSQPVTEVELF